MTQDLTDGKLLLCVTVYDSVGLKAAQCLPGSIMFMMGVDIEGEKDTNTKEKMWGGFCSKKTKGEIYNGKKISDIFHTNNYNPLLL